MGMIARKYSFKGKMMTAPQIERYYRDKGIDFNVATLNAEIKKVDNEIGWKNITENMMVELVKKTLSRKTLATASSNFKENCINEFGQEFWDELLKRKEDIRSSANFRRKMKIEQSKLEQKSEDNHNMVERKEIKDGESR